MRARNPALYTSGASVHYSGTNDMLRYWSARPHLYKTPVMYVDAITLDSTIVGTSIEANVGLIKRDFRISYQGMYSTRRHNYTFIFIIKPIKMRSCKAFVNMGEKLRRKNTNCVHILLNTKESCHFSEC